jgi:hypothetical protein
MTLNLHLNQRSPRQVLDPQDYAWEFKLAKLFCSFLYEVFWVEVTKLREVDGRPLESFREVIFGDLGIDSLEILKDQTQLGGLVTCKGHVPWMEAYLPSHKSMITNPISLAVWPDVARGPFAYALHMQVAPLALTFRISMRRHLDLHTLF